MTLTVLSKENSMPSRSAASRTSSRHPTSNTRPCSAAFASLDLLTLLGGDVAATSTIGRCYTPQRSMPAKRALSSVILSIFLWFS